MSCFEWVHTCTYVTFHSLVLLLVFTHLQNICTSSSSWYCGFWLFLKLFFPSDISTQALIQLFSNCWVMIHQTESEYPWYFEVWGRRKVSSAIPWIALLLSSQGIFSNLPLPLAASWGCKESLGALSRVYCTSECWWNAITDTSRCGHKSDRGHCLPVTVVAREN